MSDDQRPSVPGPVAPGHRGPGMGLQDMGIEGLGIESEGFRGTAIRGPGFSGPRPAVADPGRADNRWDMAIQPRLPGTWPALARALAPVLRRDAAALAEALRGPVGLVLHGLSDPEVLRARLAGITGLRVLVARPSVARFDLLAWHRPADPGCLPALKRLLGLLGYGRCRITGALAQGITRAECDAVLRRFPGAGLVAVCRDFRLFDLVLCGVDGMTPGEAADFLAVRSAIPRDALVPGRVVADLVVDRDLPRDRALAFQRDYAAIGLRTRLRPVVPAPPRA